jgi:hypothetical protein
LISNDQASSEEMLANLFQLKKMIESSCDLEFAMDGMLRLLWRHIYEQKPWLDRRVFFEEAAFILQYDRRQNAKMIHQQHYGYGVTQHSKRKEVKPLPVKMRYGITLGLAGLFLSAIPVPPLQAIGGTMVATGAGICADVLLDRQQEWEDEQERLNSY